MERHKQCLSKKSGSSTRIDPFATFNSMSVSKAPALKRLGDRHVSPPESPDATNADPNIMVVSPPRKIEQRRKVVVNMSLRDREFKSCDDRLANTSLFR